MAEQNQDDQLKHTYSSYVKDTGCSPEDLPEAMNDREKWRERVRDIRVSMMMMMMMVIYIHRLSLYHNSSVWLDMRSAPIGIKSHLTQRQVDDITVHQHANQRQLGNFAHMYQLSFVYILRYRLPKWSIREKSFAFLVWKPLFPCQRDIYIHRHQILQLEWISLTLSLSLSLSLSLYPSLSSIAPGRSSKLHPVSL